MTTPEPTVINSPFANLLAEIAPAAHWSESAACHGADTELFYFPESQKGRTAPADFYASGQALCMECPVRSECLADAVEQRDAWGMRAGLTPTQLEAAIRRAVKARKVCVNPGCTNRLGENAMSSKRYCSRACKGQHAWQKKASA